MMSMFSSFDSISWKFLFSLTSIILSFFLCGYWSLSLMNFVMGEFKMKSSYFFYILNPLKFSKFQKSLMVLLMALIFFMNHTSLYPYVFPFTSQVSWVFFLSLSIWGSFMMFNFIKNFKGQISHFIPEGAPFLLIPMLFLIELVSNLIRPLTLMIRLTANILAGHLLMIILSNFILKINLFFPVIYILSTVEFFVSIVQSFIFCTMLTLYYCEIS